MTLVLSWTLPADSPNLRAELSPAEAGRLAGMGDRADAAAFVAGHVLLRREAARWMDVGLADVWVSAACPDCDQAHGQPVLHRTSRGQVPFVSLARTADIAVVALSDVGEVGVDVERADAPAFAEIAPVLLHPDEPAADAGAAARIWVRKEAVLKATGDGLRVDPRRLAVTGADQPPDVLQWVGRDPVPSVQLYDVDLGPAHVASVAVLSARRPALNVRRVELEALAPSATP